MPNINLNMFVSVLCRKFFFPGDSKEIGIPVTNTWYFNGYNTDECFDKYFENPTENKPPTCYLGFPCTKVSLNYFHFRSQILIIYLKCYFIG